MSKTTTILVADDDPELLAILVQHLRKKNFSVLSASDGQRALEIAREHKPNLLLLDVMMPGLSGWEVAKRVRDDASIAHVGIIIMTAISEVLNALTSPLYGADERLDKPFPFDELDKKIQAVLDSRRTP